MQVNFHQTAALFQIWDQKPKKSWPT